MRVKKEEREKEKKEILGVLELLDGKIASVAMLARVCHISPSYTKSLVEELEQENKVRIVKLGSNYVVQLKGR